MKNYKGLVIVDFTSQGVDTRAKVFVVYYDIVGRFPSFSVCSTRTSSEKQPPEQTS